VAAWVGPWERHGAKRRPALGLNKRPRPAPFRCHWQAGPDTPVPQKAVPALAVGPAGRRRGPPDQSPSPLPPGPFMPVVPAAAAAGAPAAGAPRACRGSEPLGRAPGLRKCQWHGGSLAGRLQAAGEEGTQWQVEVPGRSAAGPATAAGLFVWRAPLSIASESTVTLLVTGIRPGAVHPQMPSRLDRPRRPACQ
jgi:hypothetical protein